MNSPDLLAIFLAVGAVVGIAIGVMLGLSRANRIEADLFMEMDANEALREEILRMKNLSSGDESQSVRGADFASAPFISDIDRDGTVKK